MQLKASLLSNIEDGSKLEGGAMTPKDFLYAFILNLEIFGNAFVEIAGKNLYILPSIEARVNENKEIIFENSEPDEMQLNAFKEFFGSNFKGTGNAHKTLVLTANGENAKVRIEDLSKVSDISFEKLKNLNRDEIIAAHGVPPRMVGVMTAGQLGGSGEVTGQLHSFNELTIIPKQEQIEWFFDSIGYTIKLKAIDVSNFKDDL